MANYLLQEDGSSKFVLENSSGDILLEVQPATLAVPFIASATTLYAPQVAYTGSITITTPGTFSWLCTAGITQVYFEAFGGGGGGGGGGGNVGEAGGGGGAYAARKAVPVTPGTVYTIVVGAGGADETASGHPHAGASTTFTGDSGVQVIAAGGSGGDDITSGQGGQAASSTGDSGLVFSGGNGGAGLSSASTGGGGGGASANPGGAGANGTNAGTSSGQAGGTGVNGGGSGGQGGDYNTSNAHAGVAPGGGGGGAGGLASGAAGAGGGIRLTPSFAVPFIGSTTVVYTPTLSAPTAPINVPFIASVTVVYTPTLPEVLVPFISSSTRIFEIFSLFDPNRTFGGPGNGGESFLVELNANGVNSTATLAANIGVGTGVLTMSGDSGFPTTVAFVITIDSEQLYVFPLGPGRYQIHLRGLGNTAVSTHTAGAMISWGDSYDQAIPAAANIAHQFTANILSSGIVTYPGWLMCFDSSQGYLSGDRYPMYVSEVIGVFDAHTGSGGTSRLDSPQPNVVHVPATVSDDCPCGLSNPARISTDISTGDVAVVRYTNPEASPLDLGPRSVSLQSWFGMKRVDDTDHDVTFTDPNGIVVDTTGGEGTYTGSIDGEWLNPSSIGIGYDTGLPTPNNVPYTSVTLPGTDRKFTFGSGGGGYDETGWPIGVLAVRQGNRRVPAWRSWDWHNYNFVYAGFGTDDTYSQVVVNRNGIVFGSVPEVALPGPQDIDGPDAVWDDGTYYFAACWYVAIYNGVYLVIGPSIGGSTDVGIGAGGDGFVPGVAFPGAGGPGSAVVNVPFVEGGGGGGIGQPVAGLHVWGTSGKGFA